MVNFSVFSTFLEEALVIAEKQKIATYNKYNIYHFIAEYYRHKNEPLTSKTWHDKILSLLQNEPKFQLYACQSWLLAAQQYNRLYDQTPVKHTGLRRKYVEQQANYLAEAEKLINGGAAAGFINLLLRSRALLEYQKSNFAKAASFADKCLENYKKQNHHLELIDSYNMAHDIYLAWGRATTDLEKVVKADEYQRLANEMALVNAKQTNAQKLEAVKTKFELKQKQQEELILRQRIETMNEEIRQISINLNEKIYLLDELKTHVQSFKKKSFPTEQFVNVLSQKISAIKISEQEKALLQQKIAAGNRDFYQIIAEKHPTLTSHQIHACGLLRTGVTSKELSKLFGLSKRSYDQLRYRIKKKMNLREDESLVKYLMHLDGRSMERI